MAYYVDVFSPDTYEVFAHSDRTTVGFRKHHKPIADRIKKGDKFICYLSLFSRWMGVLEVVSDYFIEEDKPLLYPKDDPLIIRFKVKVHAWLPKEQAIPMKEARIWNYLSFTKNAKSTNSWIGRVRTSLNKLEPEDGQLLENLILSQVDKNDIFEIDAKTLDKGKKWIDKANGIEVKALKKRSKKYEFNEGKSEYIVDNTNIMEIQKILTTIGLEMGLQVWLSDKVRSQLVKRGERKFKDIMDKLHLNYDKKTNKLFEETDILWFKGRKVVRAFQITSVDLVLEGLLRIADLLALQPNINIQTHIVAPLSEQTHILQQMQRPIFSLLENYAVSKYCSYLSFDDIYEISQQQHLAHLSETILDEYAKFL